MLETSRGSGCRPGRGHPRWRRRGLLGGFALLLVTGLLIPAATAAAAGRAGTGRTAATAGSVPPRAEASPLVSYDLVTAVGGVYNFGGAGWYGNERWRHLAAPIVGMAVTPSGHGYWLAGANGSVFNLGEATWYGSLAGSVLGIEQQIVSITATPDGRGYWLVNQSGQVYPFGDATPIGGGKPLPAADLATPIVSAAIAPDGAGAWFADAAGHVWAVGSAVWYGSRVDMQSSPIVSIAAIPCGRGYWLTDAAGEVWAFGGAAVDGSPPSGLQGTAVGLLPAESRYGYWVATSAGAIVDGGNATTRPGTPAQAATISDVVGIAAARQVLPVPLPQGSVGYDISWPQCASSDSSQAGPLPGPPGDPSGSLPYSIPIVGVDGWAVGGDNPCLAAEVAWARQGVFPAGSSGTGSPPYDLYMFINSPSPGSTIDQSGPAGTCSDLSGSAQRSCLAYNYGYNAAVLAVTYANSQGAHSDIWWLDIENDSCAPGMWNDEAAGEWWSCDLSLNDETIQGSLDALRRLDITAGIYCTAAQWAGITDGYVPSGGAPLLWIAGAPWSSPPYPGSYGFPGPAADAGYCTDPAYRFAGGTPVMLQETPGGSNNYAFDPDISC